jgi:hypothetical protein
LVLTFIDFLLVFSDGLGELYSGGLGMTRAVLAAMTNMSRSIVFTASATTSFYMRFYFH